jgi:hypothetical protein
MSRTLQELTSYFLVLCFVLSISTRVLATQSDDVGPAAVKYLSGHEPELQQAVDPTKRLLLLMDLAPAALVAGEVKKARNYAQELLRLGESKRSMSPALYGQAAHISNLVLGRIELKSGHKKKAIDYLLAAGKVPGSPLLKTFGPNMLLAKELLEKGEREAVIEYFDLCANFWEMQNGKLDQWKGIAKRGGIPDFGRNLTTSLFTWFYASKAEPRPRSQ